MPTRSTLSHMIDSARDRTGEPPWRRATVNEEGWRNAIIELADGHWSLLALWGERVAVHMALLDNNAGEFGIVTLACPGGGFPSVGAWHAPAIRLERAITDLFGLEPVDAPDRRPWFDHARWGVTRPLNRPLNRPPGDRSDTSKRGGPSYEFLPSEGESLHQIPVGPVHAGIIEPGHFRFTCQGEAVVRLEERLGYVHKGVESLMQDAELDRARKLAGRISGDSAVAYALAFARAVEMALGQPAPPRAIWLRAIMAELERIANHFGDIGAICNDASFSILHAHFGILREKVLRAADRCFGHRLMRDVILPGGVTHDLSMEGIDALRKLIAECRRALPPLVATYDDTPSLQDRTVSTGRLRPELARQFGAGGYVGRASSRNFDARRLPGYAPYDSLTFDVPVLGEGDVNARVWIRIKECEQSLAILEQLLDRLPAGEIAQPISAPGDMEREGGALVEGFRGDIFVWVRVAKDGRILRCHLRDPSWFQWPLLEAAIEGNIVADFPLCNKSFNCSYSGHDL